MRRYFALAALLCVPFIPVQGRGGACATTVPPSPRFVPPAPYDSVRLFEGAFWYGTNHLWTMLSADGVWPTKNNVNKNGGYTTKLVFWTQGFDWRKEPEPNLIATAVRLDGDSPSVKAAYANAVFVPSNTPAMMTGIDIPTDGCWEITGYYQGHRLAFTVSVQP